MLTRQIDDNTHEITIYDWVNKHDDYVAGLVKRDLKADEESDLRFWMFYPCGGITPLNAGDLRRLYSFIAELNT